MVVERSVRNRSLSALKVLAAGGTLAIVLAGCRRDVERVVVVGAVTYAGEAIGDGVIRFVPCDNTAGPTMVVAIVAGRYRADCWGGLPRGTYRVEVVGFCDRSAEPQDSPDVDKPGSKLPKQQFVPEKHHVESQLKMTVESDRRTLTRDFSLTP